MIDKFHGGDVLAGTLDFSTNINPLGLSIKAREAIIKNIPALTSYPQPDSRNLKKALADFHGIKQDNLAIGNGSIELIYLIPRALGLRKVLVITPTFSEYEFAARSSGAKVIFFKNKERDNFNLSLSKLTTYLSRVDSVFLCNPNNPTGLCLSKEEISTLAQLCFKRRTTLAIDEAFMDFVEGSSENNLIPVAAKRRGLIIIRSITKFFALPGLRIGYLVAHRDFISRISGLQYPWNVNSLAQAAGIAVLKDSDYMAQSRRYILEEREFLLNSLKNISGLKTFPPSSNFILCKLEKCALKSAKVLNEKLSVRRIAVRNCANFRGLNEKFFRVGVKKRAENIKLITSLREVL